MPHPLIQRPRRNRSSSAIRALVQEHRITVSDLVMPLFVIDGTKKKEAITSMPGICRYSTDLIVEECQKLRDLGICAIILFPVINTIKKDPFAKESVNDKGLYPRTIRAIKKAVPDMAIITDVAMDPYSRDGHDGVFKDGHICNDSTLPILANMAVSQAKAGANIIAPSDMMDGRVAVIREALDTHGFTDVSILSYTAKYASAFYGPFREALDSAPKKGDKKTYQMDPANVREAAREALLDTDEGADMLMVKPGLPYLDVLRSLRDITHLPLAVYNVSGEYAMLKAAGQKKWIDYPSCVLEILLSFKRAGADIIVSYHAKEAATWL